MIEVATAINNFASSEMQAYVPTTEEPIFVLTRSQLKSLIQEATAPILQEIEDLRARQDHDYERFAGDICDHGQRLRALEKIESQPLQRDRADILRALLAANGGKMLAKEARQKMRMDKGNFSRLLNTLKNCIDTKPLHQDKRKLLLIIK
jgi:DNA-binding MarR family transcriptional regulator